MFGPRPHVIDCIFSRAHDCVIIKPTMHERVAHYAGVIRMGRVASLETVDAAMLPTPRQEELGRLATQATEELLSSWKTFPLTCLQCPLNPCLDEDVPYILNGNI